EREHRLDPGPDLSGSLQHAVHRLGVGHAHAVRIPARNRLLLQDRLDLRTAPVHDDEPDAKAHEQVDVVHDAEKRIVGDDFAGAGSGKTRVLTTRIAWLLATGQVHPLAILAVTFTNKAAKEMLTRLAALTPINLRGMWVGTFHGLCNRMLRAHHRAANLPQLLQIIDTQ